MTKRATSSYLNSTRSLSVLRQLIREHELKKQAEQSPATSTGRLKLAS